MKKKFSFNTLRDKISIIISLNFLIIFIIFAFTNYFLFEKSIKNTISEKQFETISLLSNDIEARLLLIHNSVIASSKTVTKEIISDSEKAQKFLDSMIGLHSIFDNHIFLINSQGKIIAESPFIGNERRGLDISFREYVKKTLETKKPYISDPYITTQAHKSPVIMLTAPVFDENGKIIAILSGSMNLLGQNALANIKNEKIGMNGYMYLINTDRILVIHPEKEKIFTYIKKGGNKLLDRAIDEGFQGTDKTINTLGLPFLTSYKRFNIKPNWILAADYPIKEAYQPIENLKILLVFITFLLIFFMFLITPKLINWLLSKLLIFTNHVATVNEKKGNDRLFNVTGADEVDTLATAFNSMIIELDNRFTEIKEREEQFEFISTFASDMIYWIKPDNTIFYISPSCFNITGYTTKEFYDNPQLINDIIHHDDKEYWLSYEHGKEDAFEIRILTKDNKIKWVSHICREIYDGNENFLGIRGSNRDVTKNKTLELSIKEQAKILQELIDLMPSFVCLKDGEGKWLLANKADLELFHLINVDYKGKKDSELTPFTLSIYKDAFLACEKTDEMTWKAGAVQRNIEIIPVPGAEPRQIDVIKLPLFNEDGSRKGLLIVGIDMTDTLLMQERLNQAQKMEAIGQLAGGVAHDFNNILMILQGYSEILDMKLRHPDPLRKYVENMQTAINRGSRVVKQLMTFSRKQSLRIETFDLNIMLKEVLPLLNKAIREDINLEIKPNIEPIKINADRGQLEQVLINLVANSRDAMQQGGKIKIILNKINVTQSYIKRHGEIKPGKYAQIFVSDTGSGMDKKVIEHVFEPFFTTKEFGKGTGLGLSIVHGIICQHNGFINIYSEIGVGTIFKIYLPLFGEEGDLTKEDKKDILYLKGAETILYAEDDELVRDALTAILEESGYKIIEAKDGVEAIELFKQFKDEIDLLLFDVLMPRKSGKTAYDEIKKISPKVKIIFMSGYNEEILADAGKLEEGFELIEKPVTAKVLLRKIYNIIAG